MNEMLGILVKLIVTVPAEWLGTLVDLVEKLLSGAIGIDGLKHFNRKEPCWVKPIFGKLQTVAPVEKGKVLPGHQFVEQARKLAKKNNKKTLGQEAYDFYKKQENWYLMPAPESGINYVVFVEAQFDSGGSRSVRYLYRLGSEWRGSYDYLAVGFNGGRRVAVSQD